MHVTGDGNCLFCAFSRLITGTEDNHEAIRQALVAYLRLHPDFIRSERGVIDREVPTDDVQRYLFWLQHAESYLEQQSLNLSTGRWGTDLHISLLVDMLEINILKYTTSQTGQRLWVQFAPRLGVTRVGQYALYIYHTASQTHYDCVFPHI